MEREGDSVSRWFVFPDVTADGRKRWGMVDQMSAISKEVVGKRLKFPDVFFEEEVKEGFLVEKKMKYAWAAQMEVLKEIDRICVENGIRYFADSGTLLGAVRHKGFIPWDDDMDIAMLREDYHSFFAVAEKELPGGWFLIDGNERGQGYGRVMNGSIDDVGTERILQFHGCPYIVGVDIFPLDYVPPVKEEEEAWHLLLEYLWILYNDLKKGGKRVPGDELERNLRQAEEWCKVRLDRTGNLEVQVMRLMNRIAQLYGSHEAKELEMVVCDWGGGYKYKYQCEWYADSIQVPFENIMVPIPVRHHEVLIALYGEDYMTPKRNTADHNYPFYKNQDALLGG